MGRYKKEDTINLQNFETSLEMAIKEEIAPVQKMKKGFLFPNFYIW